MKTKDRELRELYEIKYNNSRGALLIFIIVTVINVLMLFSTDDYLLPFAATTPYLSVAVGLSVGIRSIFIAAICTSAVVLLLYLLCWAMSKKRYGWMTAALVLCVLDLIAVAILLWYYDNTSYGLLYIAIHVWFLGFLAMGVHYGRKLKAMARDPYYQKKGHEEEDDIPHATSYVCEEEIRDSIALRRAEEDVKHRILLEADVLGRHVCYRRIKRTNQLIISGWVYGEYKALFEEPHTLEAVIEGHIIEAGLDNRACSFITVDGKRVAEKRRLV